MVIAVVALIIIVAGIELKFLYQFRQWKVIWIYVILLGSCAGVLVASMMDVNIPSPYYIVIWMFDPVSRILFPTE